MQGAQLHRDNMEEVVSMLKSKIQRLENDQQAAGERHWPDTKCAFFRYKVIHWVQCEVAEK